MTQPLISRPGYGEGHPALPGAEKQGLPRTGYIYLVTNLLNGKEYVGCTIVPIARRWSQHLSASKKGSRLAIHNAIRKYGKLNFRIEVIEVIVGTRSDLMSAEIRQIAAHACIAPNGYNHTKGGEGADYAVPGVRERHQAAMQQLPSNPVWKEALKLGIAKRQLDHEYRERQAAGVRLYHVTYKSRNCTLCGVLLTEANTSKRSWCLSCKRVYHKEYGRQRRLKEVEIC